MKKLIFGSIALTIFALAIILFQISCRKEANAQNVSSYILPPATTSTLGGVIVDGTTIQVDSKGKISTLSGGNTSSLIVYSKANSNGIWVANVDGSNQHELNLTMPSGYELNVNNDGGQLKLSSDEKKIFFKGRNTSSNSDALFACSIDGTNATLLIDNIGTSFDIN